MATVKIKHLFQKGSRCYYSRRIPDDMKLHYPQSIIRTNLHTDDLSKAARLCGEYARHDDGLWASIRSGVDPALTTVGQPGATEGMTAILRLMQSKPKPVHLSEALERYLTEHKRGGEIHFSRDARRAVGIVTEIVGDKPLRDYMRDHARAVRDAMMINHATSTVRRQLDSVNAVFNFGRREFDIQCSNPFEKMQIAREGLDAVKRLPFSNEEFARISAACHEKDDSIRWIVGLQLMTGSRLAEIVGLRREDVFLDHEIPHIWIRPHEVLGRSLKNPGSERLVPLLGVALWGAERAIESPGGNSWLFPRYAADNDIRATHASNTINKWLRRTLGIPKTTHSARHSMKDRLRDAEVPEELAKALMGHGTRTVSDSYGTGFTLQRKAEALSKALRHL
jgi:integrase